MPFGDAEETNPMHRPPATIAALSVWRPTAGRRGWQKVRAYRTTEAIIGGVTPSINNPETLLLGRCDQHGRLRYTGRTNPLRPAHRAE
ncbi:hypothetical protein [Micromonospora cremea]|uniref:hypothetical protein n=1 Tax=Micromonospora cremea TaxID=709881 RepID=UPI0013566132|nr:hypothetical protein [Micromonospora cremea]